LMASDVWAGGCSSKSAVAVRPPTAPRVLHRAQQIQRVNVQPPVRRYSAPQAASDPSSPAPSPHGIEIRRASLRQSIMLTGFGLPSPREKRCIKAWGRKKRATMVLLPADFTKQYATEAAFNEAFWRVIEDNIPLNSRPWCENVRVGTKFLFIKKYSTITLREYVYDIANKSMHSDCVDDATLLEAFDQKIHGRELHAAFFVGALTTEATSCTLMEDELESLADDSATDDAK
jgi:hypothetical protein